MKIAWPLGYVCPLIVWFFAGAVWFSLVVGLITLDRHIAGLQSGAEVFSTDYPSTACAPKKKRRRRQVGRFLIRSFRAIRAFAGHHGFSMGNGGKGKGKSKDAGGGKDGGGGDKKKIIEKKKVAWQCNNCADRWNSRAAGFCGGCGQPGARKCNH